MLLVLECCCIFMFFLWEAQSVGDIRALRAILNQRLKNKHMRHGIHQFWKIIS